MPDKLKFTTRHLFLQVRDELAARVSSGKWKAGVMVPNEAQLAAELGVSQGTVRKALDLMESEKIVVRRQGRGTFIVDHETEAMSMRFNSISSPANDKIDGEITSQHGRTAPIDSVAMAHLDGVQSDTIYRCRRVHSYMGRKFMLEESTIVLRHWPGLTEADASYERVTSLAQRCGVVLSHAIESVRPVLADGAVCEKLDIELYKPILYLERTIYSDRGLRVEWRKAWVDLQNNRYLSMTG